MHITDRDVVPDQRSEVQGHGVLGEAGEVDLSGDRFTDELGEERGVLVLGVAVVDEDEQPFVAQRSREVLKQQHRGTVGPVRVVEDKDQRRLAGDLAEQSCG